MLLVNFRLLTSRVVHFIWAWATAQVWDDRHRQLDGVHAVLKLVVVLAASTSAEAREGRLYFPLLLACTTVKRRQQIVTRVLSWQSLLIVKVPRDASRQRKACAQGLKVSPLALYVLHLYDAAEVGFADDARL